MPKSTYDETNIFARILDGSLQAEAIFEDSLTLVFRDKFPQAKVHLLAIPKGQYTSFDDFSKNATAEEIAEFFRVVGEVARKSGLASEGYRIVANCGKNAGQEVPHFHVHILGGEALGPIISQFD